MLFDDIMNIENEELKKTNVICCKIFTQSLFFAILWNDNFEFLVFSSVGKVGEIYKAIKYFR